MAQSGMSTTRLRLLAVLAGVAAAVFVAANWSSRSPLVAPVANSDQSVRAIAAVDAVKQIVATITDETTAAAVLPSLREQSAKLLDIRDVVERLQTSERAAMATKIKPSLADLDARIGAVLKVSGVEAVVGPVLRQIAERSRALAKG